MRILSWNVNGIRAVEKKGFLQWLNTEQPDILCVQETRAQKEQLKKELVEPEGYFTYWAHALEKKGYSGVGIFTKEKPLNVSIGLGNKKYDTEGRTLVAEYEDMILFNIYFPNGNVGTDRLKYKLEFYDIFLRRIQKEKEKGKIILVCGDVNTAHTEIDLSRPKENSTVSGFLPVERAHLDKWIKNGLVDTYRMFNKEGGNYTWWDMKTGARQRNVGWRLDYFFVDNEHRSKIKDAFILKDVYGSDHCPVGVRVDRS
ncbi:MAG: exodeoxyribonuclease III [Candidatus Omnitrophica bacterium]|nr:exodeoxyribonuclease III [Candidatus Omnitrophota bacterium]